MYTGFYSAASGMVANNRKIDVLSNNVANADTAGYKKDYIVTASFGEHMLAQNGVNVGNVNYGVRPDATYTSFIQGSENVTGRSLDMLIRGEGFFNVIMPDGTVWLTRNGQFELDENGFLVDSRGNMISGANGPIMVGGADFTVNENGEIFRDGVYIDTLLITCPADYNNLDKVGEGYFVNNGGLNGEFGFSVIPGSKETSNLNMVDEMADMIAASRQYQSCAKVVQIFDEIMEKAANQVGKV